MTSNAPERPKTAVELKKRAIAIHEFGSRATCTRFCYTPRPGKDDYSFSAHVVATFDTYKDLWVVMPNAMSLPEPDLRDWHMSGVRIFVLTLHSLD